MSNLKTAANFFAAFLFLATAAEAQDAQTLLDQARAVFKQGDYRAAIVAFKKAEAAALRQYSPNDQKHDVIANELAMSYVKQGEHAAALPYYERIYKSKVNRRNADHYHYNVATALNNLGVTYDELGDDIQAEKMFLQAKELLIAAHGPDYPYLATEFTHLGNIYRDRGDFALAFEYYETSLKLYRKQPRSDEVVGNIARSLNAKASAKSALGQEAEAEKLYREALQLRKEILPPDHPNLAVSLNNVGGTLISQGKLDEALALYEESLRIREKKLGPEHMDVAVALNNLAELQRERRNPAEAEKLHRRSLAIREAKRGPQDTSVANSQFNLASLLKDTGRDAEALDLYQRALAINRKKYGDKTPETGRSLFGLATLFAKLKRWPEAGQAFDQSRRIVRRYTAQVLPTLNQSEQLAFLKSTDESNLESALAAAYQNREDQTFIDLSATWMLNAKGVGQQAIAERETLARDKEDRENPEVAATAKALEETRRELSRLTKGVGKDADDQVAQVEIARLQAEEHRLARLLAVFGGQPPQGTDWVELKDVRARLPADGLLIQIGRFRPRNFSKPSTDPDRWLPPRYAAWTIPAAGAGEVKFLDLGPADQIEGAVREVRTALENAVVSIQADGEAAAEDRLRTKLQPIADLLLKPCLAGADSVTKLYLNPDSSLWLVPWSALPLSETTYAVEKYSFNYVVSGRDLLPIEKSARRPAAPIIVADPDYDLTPANVLAAAREMWRTAPVPFNESKYRCATALGKVLRLSATAQEAAYVAPRLEQYAKTAPITYTGKSALEVVAKKFRRPQVLLISTHGFFLPDEAADRSDAESIGQRRGKAAENPLLRCGLLFGGCNSPPAPNYDDGVLTGMEIVRMDLRGTELVVLSACQTGLGQVQAGEGVAGLRQAFQLAGAQSVLATLWEIPDNDTAKLMIEFFGQLADGKDKAAALRAAQVARIESRRERRGAAHPFYWGAFTLTGRN